MKERNKKVASGVAVFLLIWWEQCSYSVEMQQALIFWPLRLLVLRVVAMLCPMCLYAIEDS
jgi:glucan phosphoethanolaminetransferase (alkaline phosphatase superfamily)